VCDDNVPEVRRFLHSLGCPACGGDLAPRSVGRTEVAACVEGCGGIWLPARALRELAGFGDVATLVGGTSAAGVSARGRRYTCPRCPDGTLLMRRFPPSPDGGPLVDECPLCAGIWIHGAEPGEARRPAAPLVRKVL
jgi:Zn-finger nucleic acid-binding protein